METKYRTICPKCQARLKTSEAAIGKRVRCPKCSAPFTIGQDGYLLCDTDEASVSMSAEAKETMDEATTSEETQGGVQQAKELPTIGKIGRFELKRELGQGAYGKVYRALDPMLDREVALKAPKFGNDPRKRERFLREAKTAAQLRHPNIVAVHEVGRDGELDYIVSEYVAGKPLSDVLDTGKPDTRQVARWVRDLADALAYAHSKGILHRDVKPANAMVDEAGRVQLMDFGLAKRVEQDSTMTAEGSVLGTPAYMAPEQARGDQQAIGPASDQYSLGVMLFEALTGKRPFEGPPHAVIAQVLTQAAPLPSSLEPSVPPELEAIIQKAMAKSPGERYADCGELARALDTWLGDSASQSLTSPEAVSLLQAIAADPGTARTEYSRKTTSSFERKPKWPAWTQSNWKWAAGASVGFALLILVVAQWVRVRDKDGNSVAEVKIPEGGSVEVGPGKPGNQGQALTGDFDDDWVDRVLNANASEFKEVFPRLAQHPAASFSALLAEWNKKPEPDWSEYPTDFDWMTPDSPTERDRLASRQANAAMALVLLGKSDQIWHRMKHAPDPRLQTYMIGRFCRCGVPAKLLIDRMSNEPDESARQALILALAEYTREELESVNIDSLQASLPSIYENAREPGLAMAAWWAMNRWGFQKELTEVDERLAKQPRSPGRPWIENSIGMKLVLIQPGQFLMGPPELENPAEVDEKPQHHVRITTPFYLGIHEVTQAHWEKMMQSKPWTAKKNTREGPDYIATCVNWEDAQEFCKRLSEQEGMAYRLPTEAEWEYACRAGTVTKYSFGNDESLLGEYAWYCNNATAEGITTWAHRAGQKRPNPWGLCDMYGNVWEWCSDWNVWDYYAKSPIENPTGPATGSVRVVRGGSWYDPAGRCRSACRGKCGPLLRFGSTGFRVVAVPAGESSRNKPAGSLPTEMEGAQIEPTPAKPPADSKANKAPSARNAAQQPSDQPALAIAPFDANQAKKHQQAWADYLGVPVERDIDYGGASGTMKLTLVLIPPGECLIGSSEEDQKRSLEEARAAGFNWLVEKIRDEGPQHRVRISKPFWLGRHEVTRGQFRQFVKETKYKTDAERNGRGGRSSLGAKWVQDPRFIWSSPGFAQTDNDPVVNVSWNDSMAFCQWLSQKQSSVKIVLPSEAQWEYACRAGTASFWHCGNSDELLQEYAWIFDNSGRKTHPVGLLRSNAWGLYDMHGNAHEWCMDWCRQYSSGSATDPVGSPAGSPRAVRAFRSGCSDSPAWACRSSDRGKNKPSYQYDFLGFRVAAVLSGELSRNKPAGSLPMEMQGP